MLAKTERFRKVSPEKQMKKISTIILDIDGTIMNSEGRISSATLKALRRCSAKGIELYVATARPSRLVFRNNEVEGDATFLIEKGAFYNGAVAFDKPLDFYRHRPISAQLVQPTIDVLLETNTDLQIALQFEDDNHSFRLPMREQEVAQWGFSEDELLPFELAVKRDCSKIVAYHDSLSLSGACHNLTRKYGDCLNIFLSDSDRWILVTACNANKEIALLDLISQRGLQPENAVVFGDDTPDAGMFKVFGRSVAMGNASNTLKKIATDITLSNDENGVAYALENILKLI